MRLSISVSHDWQIALSKAHYAQNKGSLSQIPGMNKWPVETIEGEATKPVDGSLDPETHDLAPSSERRNRRHAVLSQRHERLARPRKPPPVFR